MVKVYTSIANVFTNNNNFTAGMTVTGAAINVQSGITNSTGNLVMTAASSCLIAFGNQTYHQSGATVLTKLKIPVGVNCY